MIRTTKDLDLVALIDKGEFISAKLLPAPLKQAIEEVAVAFNMSKDWINTGLSDLLTLGLPRGFKSRMKTISYGGLTVHLAGVLTKFASNFMQQLIKALRANTMRI